MAAFKNSHWPLTMLGGVVSVLNMLLPLVLVRILSQSEMGEYKIYFLYMALLPWLCLTAGVGNGLSHWAGHKHKRLKAAQSSWLLLMVLALVFLVIAWPAQGWISDKLGWSEKSTTLLVVGALLSMLATFFEDVSIAWGNIVRGALFSSSFDLIRTMSMAWAAFHYHDVDAVFMAHIIVLALKLLVGTAWGFAEGFQRPILSKVDLIQVIRYALPVSAAAALGIGAGWSDQVILSDFLGAESFALYSFGCLMVPPLMIFEQSVNRVLIPKLSECFVEGKTEQAKKQLNQAIDELAWLHIPAAIGMAVFAEEIVTLLYTDRYIQSAEFMRLYAAHYFITHIPYDSVDRAKGRGGTILKRLMVFSVLAPMAVYAGLNLAGAKGALVGALSMTATMRLSAIMLVSRSEGWRLREILPLRGWFCYGAIGALCLISIQLLKLVMPSSLGLTTGIGWLFVGGGTFAAGYLALSTLVRSGRMTVIRKSLTVV